MRAAMTTLAAMMLTKTMKPAFATETAVAVMLALLAAAPWTSSSHSNLLLKSASRLRLSPRASHPSPPPQQPSVPAPQAWQPP